MILIEEEDLADYYDQLEEEISLKTQKRDKKKVTKMVVDGAGVKMFSELADKRVRRLLEKYSECAADGVAIPAREPSGYVI